jgi:hypothetical protein
MIVAALCFGRLCECLMFGIGGLMFGIGGLMFGIGGLMFGIGGLTVSCSEEEPLRAKVKKPSKTVASDDEDLPEVVCDV